MNWVKIIEKQPFILSRGSVLRFSMPYPFEHEVVMMICEIYGSLEEVGLMTITGYKAGISYFIVFPKNEVTTELNSDWLIKNWNKWVNPEGKIEEVYYADQLTALNLSTLTEQKSK